MVVKLATDIFNKIHSQKTIDEFFKYKSNIFKERLGNLNAAKLVRNLADYKEFKRIERLEIIDFLKQEIDNLYIDEKIKEEKLVEYTQGLVECLRRTSFIKLFTETLMNYMPKYNELKHFNPHAVSQKFLNANGMVLGTATMTSYGFDNTGNMSDTSSPIKFADQTQALPSGRF